MIKVVSVIQIKCDNWMTDGYNVNSFPKIIYNCHPFENCACIISRVNLPFCHKSMTVICEVGPQRCVMCIKNKNDKLDYSATCTYRTLYKPESCLYRNNYLVPNWLHSKQYQLTLSKPEPVYSEYRTLYFPQMHKLYCISPVQTVIKFFFLNFFKIACGALRVKQGGGKVT